MSADDPIDPPAAPLWPSRASAGAAILAAAPMPVPQSVEVLKAEISHGPAVADGS